MPEIKFYCPHCRVFLSVDSTQQGQQYPCPKCGQAIVVPTLKDAPNKRKIVVHESDLRAAPAPILKHSSTASTVCAVLGWIALIAASILIFTAPTWLKVYIPLYVLAFCLSIPAMAPRRVLNGIFILVLALFLPPILFFSGIAVRIAGGLAMSPAITGFMEARDKSIASGCMNNLRLLDGAVQQYALDNSNKLVSSMALLIGADLYIKDTPVCKGGGTYTLPASLGGKTSCSVHGSLP
jgi:hypothetical protein